MAESTLGYRRSVNDTGFRQGGFLTKTQVAQNIAAPGAPFWLTHVGANLKNLMSDATIAFAVWDTDNTPNEKLATSSRVALPYSSAVMQVQRPLTTALLLNSTQNVSIGHLILGTPSGDANDWFATFDDSGYQSYYRLNQSGITDPFGAASPVNIDGMRVYALGYYNRAPKTPSNVSPANGATVTSQQPTIAADFRDDDETLKDDSGAIVFNVGQADKLAAYQIVLRNAAGTTLWNSGVVTASGSEQTARRLSKQVGVVLPNGAVTMQIRVQDLAGAWSQWSTSSFTVSSASAAFTAPTGKITSTTPGFTVTYTNTTTDHANQYQLRLRKAGGVVVTGAAASTDVAPGASLSVTWAGTGFAAAGLASLEQGATYTPEVQLRYGAANALTAWTAGAAFTVNGPPSKPTNVTPNGVTIGRPAYPTVTAQLSDKDDPASELVGTVEITRPDNSVVTLTTGTNDGNGKWSQATTATQFTALNGTYKIRVKATDSDGLVGPWSDYATITFGDYPSVTMVAVTPKDASGNVTGAPITIDWRTNGSDTPSATDQQAWIVLVYLDNGDGTYTKVYDQGAWQSNQLTTFTLSPGAWFVNGGDYVVQVSAVNSLSMVGGINYPIHVQYTPPATLTNQAAQPAQMPGDFAGDPTGVLLRWDVSTVDPATFISTRIRRAGVLIAELTNQSVGSYLDVAPPAGKPLPYSITQLVQVNEAQIESDPLDISATLTFRGISLVDMNNGATDRVYLKFTDPAEEQINGESATVLTSGSKPTIVQGVADYKTLRVTGHVQPYDDASVVPDDQVAMCRTLGDVRHNTDGTRSPRIICYRDGRSRRLFMWLNKPRIRDRGLAGRYDVELELTEVDYDEGPAA